MIFKRCLTKFPVWFCWVTNRLIVLYNLKMDYLHSWASVSFHDSKPFIIFKTLLNTSTIIKYFHLCNKIVQFWKYIYGNKGTMKYLFIGAISSDPENNKIGGQDPRLKIYNWSWHYIYIPVISKNNPIHWWLQVLSILGSYILHSDSPPKAGLNELKSFK